MKKEVTRNLPVRCAAGHRHRGRHRWRTSPTPKSATNTFTVGNVKIDLLESSLHRENAGVANGATSTSELWSDVAKEGSSNTSKYKAGDTFYTDAQIEANAAEYKCENVQLIPGRSYHKMPYVKNVGNNDAYIRIRVMIPADLDTAVLNSSMYTSSAMDKEFTMAIDQTGTVEREGRQVQRLHLHPH